MKRLQNRISESRLTLPVVSVYGLALWAASGMIDEDMGIPFGCFAVSTYLMMEMNTSNALIRIYSRMVSCAFIVLSAMAGPVLHNSPSTSATLLTTNPPGAVLCIIAAYIMLFRTYQDRRAMGRTYYAFLLLGLASILYVETLYFIPALWLLIMFYLQAASWRNFFASLFGLLTPYWFAGLWIVYTEDFTLPLRHFARLAELHFPPDYTQLTAGQIATFAFILAIGMTGTIHYVRTSYNDKIRIRMLYNFFIAMNLLSAAFLIAQPQHYDFLTRLMTVNTCPLIAHFIALTQTRITNMAFYAIVAAALLLTGYNLWTSSLIF